MVGLWYRMRVYWSFLHQKRASGPLRYMGAGQWRGKEGGGGDEQTTGIKSNIMWEEGAQRKNI